MPRTARFFRLACLLALACLAASLAPWDAALGKTRDASSPPAFDAASPQAFEQVISRLADLGDRTPGSPGAARAAELVEQGFSSLGLQHVGRHRFSVPVQRAAEVGLNLDDGRRIPLSAMALNALTPSSARGLASPLIYAGRGETGELRDLNLAGAIVVLEIDSAKNWMTLANLGASAAIYVDRGRRNVRGFFEDAFELTPVRFPRFFLDDQGAIDLLADRQTPGPLGRMARIDSDAALVETQGENVYAFIKGTDPELAKQTLILQAPLDGYAYVLGHFPGADQAVSLATLLECAKSLKNAPPKRSVLLAVTSGHGQTLAGWREFLAVLRGKGKDLRTAKRALDEQAEKASVARDRLKAIEEGGFDTAAFDDPALEAWLTPVLKNLLASLDAELTRRRLGQQPAMGGAAEELSARRTLLLRLTWRGNFKDLSETERREVWDLAPLARQRAQTVAADAARQAKSVGSARELRQVLDEGEVAASVSLHLSSHGDGLGAFSEGWLYQLKPEINRQSGYASVSRFLASAAQAHLKTHPGPLVYHDALRSDRQHPWRALLPDHPALGGEAAAMAGLLGLTLATTGDSRMSWGGPADRPEFVDLPKARAQAALVAAQVSALCGGEFALPANLPRNGFTTLSGRAKIIRQGELFPEEPALGAFVLVYQGNRRFYAAVNAGGEFRVPGLADNRHTLDKAVVEAYRFDPATGEANLAIDKKLTGREAYRVRLRRQSVETDVVMFACRQSTIFSTIDPRSFRYFTKIELLDARREAEPLRSWFSRLDTLESSLVSLFLEPGTAYKLLLSDTVLTRKMLLLNASQEHPEGVGYMVDEHPVLVGSEYRAASDMWRLLTPRVRNLENHGIFNERIRALSDLGVRELGQAAQAREAGDEAAFLDHSRMSWAEAIRVYADVEKTQRDVLVGVLFYIALFVPFAYCLERLFFSFADIHKRLAALFSLLGATIGVVYVVHPAFKLTYAPGVVILAFFILSLSVLVSGIIFMRFEREMEELRRKASHRRTAEVGRLKAFAASFAIGVSNLRRRPVRTGLTIATLTLLTFTILGFTSVKSVREETAVPVSPVAPYKGLFLRNANWLTLPDEALSAFRDAFAATSPVAPRGFFESTDRSEATGIELLSEKGRASTQGVLGLSAQEPRVTGLDKILVEGRWISPADRFGILLPKPLAESLGVSARPGNDKLRLLGREFTVRGVFDPVALDAFRDLDGEPVTPVIFPSEAAAEESEAEREAAAAGEDVQVHTGRYQHLPSAQVVILPYDVMAMLGGTLKSAAVGQTPETRLPADLSGRFSTLLFRGDDTGVYAVAAGEGINYAGAPNVAVPIAIAALIVLNTMIGAVFERRREIAVYTSVGLAPSHVAFLFVAEAMAYAVISVVLGYLAAQAAAALLSGTPVWAGMTANYSSLSGVASLLLVMAVVLVSTLYPSRLAADIAIPDVNRSFALPEAAGDALRATLPFLMRVREQDCAGGFLLDYYESYRDASHGLFSTKDVRLEHVCPWEADEVDAAHPAKTHAEFCDLQTCYRLAAQVWLAPFDFGIRQEIVLNFLPAEWHPGYMEIEIELRRVSGEKGMWRRLNKGFINHLRKQLLVWRSLDEEAREAFTSLARGLVGSSLTAEALADAGVRRRGGRKGDDAPKGTDDAAKEADDAGKGEGA